MWTQGVSTQNLINQLQDLVLKNNTNSEVSAHRFCCKYAVGEGAHSWKKSTGEPANTKTNQVTYSFFYQKHFLKFLDSKFSEKYEANNLSKIVFRPVLEASNVDFSKLLGSLIIS